MKRILKIIVLMVMFVTSASASYAGSSTFVFKPKVKESSSSSYNFSKSIWKKTPSTSSSLFKGFSEDSTDKGSFVFRFPSANNNKTSTFKGFNSDQTNNLESNEIVKKTEKSYNKPDSIYRSCTQATVIVGGLSIAGSTANNPVHLDTDGKLYVDIYIDEHGETSYLIDNKPFPRSRNETFPVEIEFLDWKWRLLEYRTNDIFEKYVLPVGKQEENTWIMISEVNFISSDGEQVTGSWEGDGYFSTYNTKTINQETDDGYFDSFCYVYAETQDMYIVYLR